MGSNPHPAAPFSCKFSVGFCLINCCNVESLLCPIICASRSKLCAFYFFPCITQAFSLQSIILGCVLFPVRITLATLFFLLMWPIARLRLTGLSREERAKPVRGWRQWFFHPIIAFLSRSVFFSMGFFCIKVKGRQATQKEAPVLAVAPHSGFLDMLVLSIAGLPTVVSRSENSNLPVIGGERCFRHWLSLDVVMRWKT